MKGHLFSFTRLALAQKEVSCIDFPKIFSPIVHNENIKVIPKMGFITIRLFEIHHYKPLEPETKAKLKFTIRSAYKRSNFFSLVT